MNRRKKMIVKAAAVQMAPVFLNTQATLEKILGYMEQAADEGLELLVFPETILPGYPYWAMTHDSMSHLGRFNQRLHAESVVVPGPEKDREGLLSAELDFEEIVSAKIVVDGQGHYARPDVVQLQLNASKQQPLVIRDE
jgi:predicted amidohydrolase